MAPRCLGVLPTEPVCVLVAGLWDMGSSSNSKRAVQTPDSRDESSTQVRRARRSCEQSKPVTAHKLALRALALALKHLARAGVGVRDGARPRASAGEAIAGAYLKLAFQETYRLILSYYLGLSLLFQLLRTTH